MMRQATFNKAGILQGGAPSALIQVGDTASEKVDISAVYTDATINAGTVTLANNSDCQNFITKIDTAYMANLKNIQKDLEAAQGQLQSVYEDKSQYIEKASAGLSRVRDVNTALEVSDKARYDVLLNASVMMASQSVQNNGSMALKVLQSNLGRF
jgi:flagellin-like hook-associated protein FlgL